MSGRFDERCPYCGEKLEIYGWFVNQNDYGTHGFMDCEHCGGKIEVTVHTVPEFELEQA